MIRDFSATQETKGSTEKEEATKRDTWSKETVNYICLKNNAAEEIPRKVYGKEIRLGVSLLTPSHLTLNCKNFKDAVRPL